MLVDDVGVRTLVVATEALGRVELVVIGVVDESFGIGIDVGWENIFVSHVSRLPAERRVGKGRTTSTGRS